MTCFAAFFIFCLLTKSTTSQSNAVNPPIVRVTNGAGAKDMSRRYDFSVRRYSHVIPATRSEAKTTSPPVKRDNPHLLNGITSLSAYDKNILDEDLGDQNCAFTFNLPNPIPTNQQVCVTDVRSMTMMMTSSGDHDDDEALEQLRQEVLRWHGTIDGLKKKIETRLISPGLGRVKNELNFLRNESRNMNERIVRLHMLLLNEIIRERDETIEITRMENDILNSSLKYLELKDKHESLVSEHKILQQKFVAQGEVIEYLQKRMEDMTGHMNKVTLKAEEAAAWCKLAATRRPDDLKSHVDNTSGPSTPPVVIFRDCSKVQDAGITVSGIYRLAVPNVTGKVKVWCDLDQDPGGWTVIQRRSSKKLNFYRNLGNYQRGFGAVDGDHWLGLDNIHQMTSQAGITYKLHIDMEDWSGGKTFVEYGSFKIAGEDDGYRLKIAHYSGTAGDSLSYHNNMKFSAKNVDNDMFERSCPTYHRGGWWYNACAHANLNGIYHMGGHYRSSFQNGIYWLASRGGSYSLKRVEMKIRPSE